MKTNRCKRYKKQITSFVLSLVLLITSVPYVGGAFAADGESLSLSVQYNGKEESSIIVEYNEKKTLEAVGLEDGAEYQWQIKMPDGSGWADIADKQDSSCEISTALLESALTETTSQTAIRCKGVYGGEEVVSNVVYITLCPEVENEISVSDASVNVYPVEYNDEGTIEENPEYVTITIHYYLDGDQAFDDYIATLRYGSSFSANVPSPNCMGYAPYMTKNGAQTDDIANEEEIKEATTVALSYTEISENKEIYVYYMPALSAYTVRYFLQNVSDDLYTEDAANKITGKALTGTYPKDDVEKEIDGFTALTHEPDVVAADGTTEFECYYDRNYYLYEFDNNGGYGVDPVYARHGTHLVVGEPTRSGYSFGGWDLYSTEDADGDGVEDGYDGVADALPSTVEIGNRSYRAIWEANDTTITVVYWRQNPDDDDYSYWDSTTVTATSGTVIKYSDLSTDSSALIPLTPPNISSDDLQYYYFDDVHTQEVFSEGNVNGELVEGDGSSVVNVYYKRHEYKLKFIYARSVTSDDVTTYYVAGASTYDFGTHGYSSTDTNDVTTLLDQVSGWGAVDEPTLNDIGQSLQESGKYTLHTLDASDGYTYYYIQMTVRYGEDMQETWPTGAFDPVGIQYAATHNSVSYAVFSAWNGEHHVKYTQDNSNETIKGTYLRFDENLLYSSSYSDTYYKVDADGNYLSTDSNGYYVYNNNSYTEEDGDFYMVDDSGNLIDDDGVTLTKNSDGTLTDANGKYLRVGSDSSYYEADANGNYVDSDGNALAADGDSYYRINSDGDFIDENGNALTSDGNGGYYYADASGNTVTSSRVEGELVLRRTAQKFYDTVRFLAFWENGTDACSWNIPRKWTYSSWIDLLDSEIQSLSDDDKSTIQSNGTTPTTIDGVQYVYYNSTYYEFYDEYVCCDNNQDIDSQTPPPVYGCTLEYKYAETDTLADGEDLYYASAHTAYFFYKRNTYKLYLRNGGTQLSFSDGIDVKDYIDVKYEGKIMYQIYTNVKELDGATVTGEPTDDSYDFVIPPYPSTLEPNAYEFDGWYTSPQYLDETKVTDLNTMDASDLMLYAKWSPVEHTVTFSNTYDDMTDGVYITSDKYTDGKIPVAHNDYMLTSDIPEASSESLPEDQQGYVFVGWFYFDETGEKRKAFDPSGMPVTDDLHLFAEWSSSTVSEYTITYKYVLDDGTVVEDIADETVGHSYVGTTRTFSAKTGTALKDGYQVKYYPTIRSSSILLQDTAEENVIDFQYVYREKMGYTVQYVDATTGEKLADDTVVESTDDMVVTAKFKYISGYISDSYYKSLILVADESENVITFYYTADTSHARYVVHYYTQNLPDDPGTADNPTACPTDEWTEYSSIEGVGDIGGSISADIMSITGFEYYETTSNGATVTVDSTNSSVSATIPTPSEQDSDNLEINIYYTRKSSTYKVRYVEYGNVGDESTDLQPSTTLTFPYLTELSYDAGNETITVSSSSGDVTYTRRGDGQYTLSFLDGEQTLFVYYTANSVTVNYVAVSQFPGTNFGSVSSESETVSTASNFAGSTPTAGANYEFVGWYTDPGCTTAVEAGDSISISDDNTLKLLKMPGSDVTYYALFVPTSAFIKIKKTVDEAVSEDRTFLFNISGTANSGETVDKTISLTVPAGSTESSVIISNVNYGTYTVTEDTSLSWKYTPTSSISQSLEITESKINTVEFVNSLSDSNNKQWLGGEAQKTNTFSK